ncbi:MAG: lipopolysaccharide assembly protein LapA domain-containing protein [Candidatus Aminicenantaceae bacterium]
MKKKSAQTKLIILIVLVILAAILVIQNTGVVTFKLFFWTISMSRIIMMSLFLLFGFVLGLLAASPLMTKRQK